jgi:hypothetical protein
MFHFLANEFSRLRAGCFAFAFVLSGSFERSFLWHDNSPAGTSFSPSAEIMPAKGVAPFLPQGPNRVDAEDEANYFVASRLGLVMMLAGKMQTPFDLGKTGNHP